MRRSLWLVALAAGLCGQAGSGLGVGGRAPDFTAPDQAGHIQTLKSIMGPKGALLVFYRSADW
jgi:hypothetical protein